MEVVGSPGESGIEEQGSKVGHSLNVSTSDARLQEQKNVITNTTLADRGATVLKVAGTIGGYADAFTWMGQSAIDGIWAQFSSLATSKFLNTVALALGTGTAKLTLKDVQQAVGNIVGSMENGEVQKGVALAGDVLMHPEKNRDFEDGTGAKFGKKDTLRQMEVALKKLDSMGDQGDSVAIGQAKELLTVAKNIAQKQLNVARAAKACRVAASTASMAANVAGVIGTGGASLIPWVINVATANIASAADIAQEMVGKTHAAKEVFAVNMNHLSSFSPDVCTTIEGYHTLAMDVLTHPEKNRDFEDGTGAKFGKKETKQILGRGLKDLASLIRDTTDSDAQGELGKVQQNVKTAHGKVSSKLRKARVVKGAKITSAVFGTAAVVAAGVATFGFGTIAILPAISVGIGVLGTTINNANLVRRMG
ncbi:MAG: hypothetical protein LBC11_03705 [Puniceicoccales bacterium]|jgi:hypothetical protein|nr:hypothetical protein [Puniceicoccales bacterium]